LYYIGALSYKTIVYDLYFKEWKTMNYVRKNIAAISGYVPGEQPQGRVFVKLNTNENPYPPSPKVSEALRDFSEKNLRLYSEPSARMLRCAAAERYNMEPDEVLCGNGSDDLLTIALRTFVDQGGTLAFTNPSYSLYPVLADIQGAKKCPVELDENFQLPENAAELAGNATLFLLCRPNAPTGTSLLRERLEKLCREFHGVVWIDEAYVDFSEDDCLDFVHRYPNVVVSRTFSKSFSLAGLRLGLAFANTNLIAEMNKVKDSYNVDMITQYLGSAALKDYAYMQKNVRLICKMRSWTTQKLQEIGCEVLPSSANFIFVKTPIPAAEVFLALRNEGFLVRYFDLPRISGYLRVTMGLPENMEGFIRAMKKILSEKPCSAENKKE